MYSSSATVDCHRITWKVENEMVSIQFWGYDGKSQFETIIHQVITFKPEGERYSFPMTRFKPEGGDWENYFVIMQTEEKENATADTTEGAEAQPEQCASGPSQQN